MTRIPRRVSLVAQVADILRQDLREGRWPEQLPGEHYLSDLLKVSRSTLRSALDILRRERLIQVSQGRRRWLTPASSRTKLPPSKTVGAVSSLPLQEMSGRSIFVMDELRRHLQQSGFDLEVHALPPSTQRAEIRRLNLLVERTRAACWVLSSCTKELQAWFAQSPWPTLVLGSCHEGIDLPSLTLDYAAACRHAVGVLRRLGHRHIALVLERAPFAGMAEVEQSFRESFPEPEQPLVRCHDGSVANLERLLTTLMRSEARPTALIAMRAADSLTILCHLLNGGTRVPADVSLVSLFDDFFLTRVRPTLARYTYNNSTFARRLARLVIQMATSRDRPVSVRIIPDFLPGGTTGAPAPGRFLVRGFRPA